MNYSYSLNTGDGTTKQFAVPFSYLDQADVHVYVNGVDSSYVWNGSSLVITTVPPPFGYTVEVKRVTSESADVSFANATELNALDLNTAVTQCIYLTQEALDTAEAALGPNTAHTSYYAGGKTIQGVADPVNVDDAATKAYVDNKVAAAVLAAAAVAGSQYHIVTGASYTPSAQDRTIEVNQTVPAAISMALPAHAGLPSGWMQTYVDGKGQAGSYPITITTDALIRGLASYTVAEDFGSVTFTWNGTSFVIT